MAKKRWPKCHTMAKKECFPDEELQWREKGNNG